MIKLTMIPQHGADAQPEMTLHVAGDVLTIDATEYDLSAVPEDGEGWPDDGPFIGPITRLDGVLRATVLVRLGPDAALDPGGPWLLDASGDVTIPAARKPEEVTE